MKLAVAAHAVSDATLDISSDELMQSLEDVRLNSRAMMLYPE